MTSPDQVVDRRRDEELAVLRARVAELERERKEIYRLELTLQHREEMLRRIIQAMPGGYVEVGLDGSIRMANDEAIRILGLSLNELTQRYVQDFESQTIWEDGTPCSIDDYPVTKCLRTGQPQPLVTIGIHRPDGQVFWAVFSATPLLSPTTREPEGAVVMFLDITARKHDEELLRKNQIQFAQAQRAAGVGSWEWDVINNVAHWSDEHYRMYGLTPQDGPITREKFLACLHPDDRPAAQARIEQAIKHGQGGSVLLRVVWPNGEVRMIHSHGEVQTDASGRPVKFLGISQDVTEYKYVEAALRESQQRYRAFIEQSAEGIWCFDLAEPIAIDQPEDELLEHIFTNARLTECNNAMARMYGHARGEDILGRNIREFVVPEDPQNIELFRTFVRSGFRITDAESHEIDRTGQSKVFLNNMLGILEDGMLRGIWGVQRDITERKAAEAAVRTAQSMYQSLVESIDGVVWEAQFGSLNFSYVSRRAEALLGFPAEQWIEEEGFWVNHMHPEDRTWVPDYCISSTKKMQNHEFEYRMIAADGRVVWVRDIVAVVAEGGWPTRLRGVMVDITQRKRAEEALRASERRYRRLVEGVRLIAWEYDRPTQSFTFVSHHAEEILGYPLEAWYAPNFWYNHLHPDDRQSADAFSCEHANRGLDHQFEYRMVHADGRVVWFRDITTVGGEDGNPNSLHGVLIDITERKRAEEALRESETRFRVLADNSSVGFWQLTPDGYTVYVNPEMCRLLEVSGPEELVGRTYHEFFTPESQALVAAEHKRRAAGVASAYEVDLVGKRGTLRSVIISGAPLMGPDGSLQGMIATLTDISVRKRAEETVRQHSETRRLMLSELDHRVRNNLASLMALIDISARNQTNVREFAESMKRRVHAMATVHSMLSMGHWTALSLHSLIEQLTPADLRHAVIISGPDVPIAPRQVAAAGMVFQELIANSLKYGALGQPTGRVDVEYIVRDAPEDASLTIEMIWREAGGPVIVSQPVAGVGTGLIQGLVRAELGGTAEMSYPHRGAFHRFVCKLDRVDPAAQARRDEAF